MNLIDHDFKKTKIKIERRVNMLGEKIIKEKKHYLSQENLAEWLGLQDRPYLIGLRMEF